MLSEVSATELNTHISLLVMELKMGYGGDSDKYIEDSLVNSSKIVKYLLESVYNIGLEDENVCYYVNSLLFSKVFSEVTRFSSVKLVDNSGWMDEDREKLVGDNAERLFNTVMELLPFWAMRGKVTDSLWQAAYDESVKVVDAYEEYLKQ